MNTENDSDESGQDVTRFDLEEAIQKCWGITEDVHVVYGEVCEREPTSDEIANMLLGIEQLYSAKFNNLWRIYEQLLKQKVL